MKYVIKFEISDRELFGDESIGIKLEIAEDIIRNKNTVYESLKKTHEMMVEKLDEILEEINNE